MRIGSIKTELLFGRAAKREGEQSSGGRPRGGAPLDGQWGGTTAILTATHITRVGASSGQVSQNKAHTPASQGGLGERRCESRNPQL